MTMSLPVSVWPVVSTKLLLLVPMLAPVMVIGVPDEKPPVFALSRRDNPCVLVVGAITSLKPTVTEAFDVSVKFEPPLFGAWVSTGIESCGAAWLALFAASWKVPAATFTVAVLVKFTLGVNVAV